MRFSLIARLAVMAGFGLTIAVATPASAARNDHGAGARSQASRSAARPAATAPRAAVTPRSAPARSTRQATAPARQAAAPRNARAVSNARAVTTRTAARGTTASPLLHRVSSTGSMRGQPAILRGSANMAAVRGQAARQQASSCRTVRGRRVCTGTRQVALRWSNGIAPAGGQQSSCPDGTMAMLALGHENVYRCVPL
ncbi:hypothetical protein EOD42_19740 [Rhodovarius crocodyli]|uniref:Ig-like domain-containing protein n=1 Tax=Rhodovarius crocodyli TaxID=1979269 RepID=A0A437M346_9PROT|nr:hypothetical protein [Rhodovarius crocodyli]RVT91975.1 hypothetical protein EOD42_19740 [Rhodovarius crocodyli]